MAHRSAASMDDKRTPEVEDQPAFSMVDLTPRHMVDNDLAKSVPGAAHPEDLSAGFSYTHPPLCANGSQNRSQPAHELKHRAKAETSLNALDLLAVVVSLLALAFAIATISPSLPWAAQLQYTNQIVVIGFLLGIMNMAMLRTLPYLFLVLEQRLGPSSLQNYDGLLRWSPLSSQMSSVWQMLIISSLLLPLGLSVLYKRYVGGIGTQHLTSIDAHFSPSALPGLQNVSGVVIQANATAPFISAIQYNPVPDYANYTNQPYGYNLLVISNESAAAIDVPVPSVISRLQAELHADEAYLLETSSRATVAKFNNTFNDDSQRNFDTFWTTYGERTLFDWRPGYDGAYFGMLNVGVPNSPYTSTIQWDNSWAFVGNFNSSNVKNTSDPQSFLRAFLPEASALDIRRHDCTAQFKISQSSVRLERGNCSPEPLPYQYQFYEQTQLATTEFFMDIIAQTLGRPFDGFTPTAIHPGWQSPTFAAILASAFQARVAMTSGIVPLNGGGSIPAYWDTHQQVKGAPVLDNDYQLNETYFVPGNTLLKTGPTLRAEPSLYLIMSVMPAITIAAFLVPLATIHMNKDANCPIILPRQFNMVAILAGMDRESLDVFGSKDSADEHRHATLTGKMRGDITMHVQSRSPRAPAGNDGLDETEGQLKNPPSLRYVLRHRATRETHEKYSFRKWQLRHRSGLRSAASSSSKAVLLPSSSPTL